MLTQNPSSTRLPSPDGSYEPDIDARDLQPSGRAFNFASPLQLLSYLWPELEVNALQTTTLLTIAGYTDLEDISNLQIFTPENPLKLVVAGANGSGKDMIILAATAVWWAMKGVRNRFICTSASFEQLRYQTEPHIKELINRVNAKYGKVFSSALFHHVCLQTASEIKLFVTDEEGRVEGYHPWMGGQMALAINEAKTVGDEIFRGLKRCTGYSMWLEVSSFGLRSGQFFRDWETAVKHPAPFTPNKFYGIKIRAVDCPHIPRSHIEDCRQTMSAAWLASSIDCEPMDSEEDVVISYEILNPCISRVVAGKIFHHVVILRNDYVVSLDSSAGGDETVCFVRHGNLIIDQLIFREQDTVVGSARIANFLLKYKHNIQEFLADNGGISKSYVDNLSHFGYIITRVHNESAARNKREYLNIGAENYFHTKRLLAQKLIPVPDDPLLHKQLTSRRYDNLAGGKYRLEDKKLHKARTGDSPDRADAYVLLYRNYSYHLAREATDQAIQTKPPGLSWEEIEAKLWQTTISSQSPLGHRPHPWASLNPTQETFLQ